MPIIITHRAVGATELLDQQVVYNDFHLHGELTYVGFVYLFWENENTTNQKL